MTFTKQDGEFIVLTESTTDFQKKIKQWLSTGYSITILHQDTLYVQDKVWITASIIRKKVV